MNLRHLLLFALFSLPIMGCGPTSPSQQGSLDGKLLEAVLAGNTATIDSCLRAGADANARDAYGMPAILLAARGGQVGVAASLLQHGASADDSRLDAFGSTPLMEASAHNDTAMARLLLANGADVLRRDTFGDPALNWAAYYGHIAYADVLLSHGAKWDVASRNGTALDIAAQQWHLELLDFFIDKGAGPPLEIPGAQALVRAVKQGRAAEARQLLDTGASANQKDELGTPLLLWAAALGREEMVELLLANGADPNAYNRAGYTALAASARFGHASIASRLLDHGAAPDAAGPPYHTTPLMCAAMGGHADIGELLLNRGAAIDTQDTGDGFTALMHATANGHKDMVRLLIRYRANPYMKSQDGTGLYELVSYAADPELAKIIENYVMIRQQ